MDLNFCKNEVFGGCSCFSLFPFLWQHKIKITIYLMEVPLTLSISKSFIMILSFPPSHRGI